MTLFLYNPSKCLLENFDKSSSSKNFSGFIKLVKSLAKKIEITPPTIEIVCGLPFSGIYGISKKNSQLIVSENLIKSLDKDELLSLIFHELFHQKSGDVETRTLMYAHRRLFHPQFVQCFVYSVGVTVMWFIASLMAAPFLLINPFFQGYLEYTVVILFGWPIVIIVLIIIEIWKVGLGSAGYLYIYELLADSFSSLQSLKPAKLRSAIIKVTGHRDFPKLSNAPISTFSELINSKIYSKNMNKYMKDVVTLKRTLLNVDEYVREKVDYRFYFIELLEILIFTESKLDIFNNQKTKIKYSCPIPVKDFVKSHQAQFYDFLKYSKTNKDNFNLIECSEFLGMKPFGVLLFLWAAVHSEIIDIQLHKNIITQNQQNLVESG